MSEDPIPYDYDAEPPPCPGNENTGEHSKLRPVVRKRVGFLRWRRLPVCMFCQQVIDE